VREEIRPFGRAPSIPGSIRPILLLLSILSKSIPFLSSDTVTDPTLTAPVRSSRGPSAARRQR
jgi:hypothetical protein